MANPREATTDATETHELVILVDVDYTLLDGARVRELLAATINETLTSGAAEDFWRHYDAIRVETGLVDVPAALRRLAPGAPEEARLLAALDGIDFASCLLPGALDALAHLGRIGTTVVLSDGDAVFQRSKIERAGIAAAVEGRVVVAKGKVSEIAQVRAAYPAHHYAMFEDRPRILEGLKAQLGAQLTAVLVRQGPYPEREEAHLEAVDLVLDSITEVHTLTATTLLEGARPAPRRD